MAAKNVTLAPSASHIRTCTVTCGDTGQTYASAEGPSATYTKLVSEAPGPGRQSVQLVDPVTGRVSEVPFSRLTGGSIG